MDGRTPSFVRRGELACHCLLVETADSLVLVDTGLGLGDVREPYSRLSAFFLALVSPDFREDLTAVRQIARLGYDPADVRHIVLSHLDFDHAGGLDDFPGATVHMLQAEHDNAAAQGTWLDRQRFRPQQWTTRPKWRVYPTSGGERWFGFERARQPDGVPPEIAMIPLIGHTHGHCGIAVKTSDKWLLLAADAYFHRDELDLEHPRCTPGLRFYQWMLEKNRSERLRNQHRLRELRRAHGDEVTIFSGHDIEEFERLAGHSARLPPDAVPGLRRRIDAGLSRQS